MEPRIIFEDEDLAVIDKPAGMIVNDAATVDPLALTVQRWHGERIKIYDLRLKNEEFYRKSGIVHRLDKDTSGVMVLAKNEQAYYYLKQQFVERKTQKRYTALVHNNHFEAEEGVISAPIDRHPKNFGKRMVIPGGRAAVTEWKIIKRFPGQQKEGLALLELTPLTGRTHQIRVHLKHIGHPIVSDPLYIGRKTYRQDVLWCPRLFLHASYLRLMHPAEKDYREYESPLPAVLEQTLEFLIH
ncbi:hypothetical protein A2701_00165 [Candidatus Amesbacteria bacterium RIFCSPHIGHO2_01_FULL_47_34]|nr:MAG: hypothetical protein A2701_00165 [Candidatus Amesbacteria bacterium RIFCSPHIGHO2_01_FULL_47_34]